MNYKIEQTILRLEKNVEQNNKHDLIKFENGFLRINENRSEANWVILSYILFLILTPITILIYLLISNDYYWLIGLFIFIPTTFILEFKKMIIGSTTLEINFNEEYFGIKNNTILFKSILKPKKINFKEVVKSELIKKSVYHEYSKTSRWQQLSVIDKKGKKHILTDFDSDNTIVNDVKKIIEIIISDNKLLNRK